MNPTKKNVRLWSRVTKVALVLGFAIFLVGRLTAAGPPSSKRSERAIAKVKPKLLEALKDQKLDWGSAVYLRIFKEEQELELWLAKDGAFTLFKTYPICTFSGELGPKLAEGDLQAPEGFYGVTADLMNPWSKFHLSFNVGYPNQFDRAQQRTGSYIMVHGNCVSTGCFAMTDPYIEEIYALVDAALRAGKRQVPVHVFPFRLTADKLASRHDSPWHSFWSDLKIGWDYFEKNRTPPTMRVRQGRYRLTE